MQKVPLNKMASVLEAILGESLDNVQSPSTATGSACTLLCLME